MDVVLNGIEPEDQVDPIRRTIEADFGVKARYDRANLMDPAGVLELMAGAEERFGGVDVLVNNAGISSSRRSRISRTRNGRRSST